MKTNRHLCSLLLIVLLAASFQAQAQQHVIKESFEAASEVNIRHRRGPLNVAPSEDGKIHFEAEISFDSNDEAEAKKLIDAFSVKAGKVGDRVDIDSNLGIKSMNSIGNISTITMANGTKIKGIKNLKVYLTVKVPEVRRLKVDNRYNDINVYVEVKDELHVDAYSADLRIGNVGGNLTMSAKYSKGTVKDFKNGNIELYESKINFGKAQNLEMNAKYSTVELTGAQTFKAESYENKLKFGNIEGLFQIGDKYSTIYLSDIGDATLELYETDIKGVTAKDMQIKSKYADMEWTSAGKIYFISSYEDDLTIAKATSLQALESKYSKYKIGELQEKLEIESFEDDIFISNAKASLDLIKIKGKYTELHCPISSSTPFQVDITSKYSSFDISEDDLEFTKYIEKGDSKEISGKRNNATDQSLKIQIDCYDCKVKLKG